MLKTLARIVLLATCVLALSGCLRAYNRDPNVEKRVVTVLFEDGKLASVDGTAAVEVQQERKRLTNPKSVDPTKAKKKKGKLKDFWKKIKDKATRKKS